MMTPQRRCGGFALYVVRRIIYVAIFLAAAKCAPRILRIYGQARIAFICRQQAFYGQNDAQPKISALMKMSKLAGDRADAAI